MSRCNKWEEERTRIALLKQQHNANNAALEQKHIERLALLEKAKSSLFVFKSRDSDDAAPSAHTTSQCKEWVPPSLSSVQKEMIQSLFSAEAAIAAGKMNADEVFPSNDAVICDAAVSDAAVSNTAVLSNDDGMSWLYFVLSLSCNINNLPLSRPGNY